MQLIHYDSQPIVFDHSRIYDQEEPRWYGKPEGFWVSVAGEDDWLAWCQDNAFSPEDLACPHEVTLRPGANLLHISSPEGMEEFHAAYSVPEEGRAYQYLRPESIDWRKVAADYDGLINAPYQWQCRISMHFYYGWDCASGCIWNVNAIAEVVAL